MPTNTTSQLRDPELYDRLREDGASAEKAARISNAAAHEGRSVIGRRGATAKDYDDRTVPELKQRAKELGLSGYSNKRKHELIQLLRDHA